MNCQACGGVIGVDCFNPQECMEITRDMVRMLGCRPRRIPTAMYQQQVQCQMDSFSDARAALLSRFDLWVSRLRAVVADPEWCNTNSRDFKEASAELAAAASAIERLNDVQMTAKLTGISPTVK